MRQATPFPPRAPRGTHSPDGRLIVAAVAALLGVACGPQVPSSGQQGTQTSAVSPARGAEAPAPVLAPNGASVDVTSSVVPVDVNGDTAATQTQLATFAWQEFVALNWPSSYSATTPTRGQPSSDAAMTFVSVTTQTTQPLVWQTYKHRVEVFPETTTTYNSSFDTPPQYSYPSVAGSGPVPAGDVYPCTATGADPNGIALSKLNSSNGQLDYFNNLDETTEINLNTMYVDTDPAAPPVLASYMNPVVGGGRRFIYEAKANATMFDYIAGAELYDLTTRWAAGRRTLAAVTQNNQGGVAPCPTTAAGESIVCFPPGETDISEGTIEVKATWRQLTLDEYNSGRFLIAPIIRYYNYDSTADALCYQTVPAVPTANTLPYGLAALHIIHKTTSFPTFVFATFEQVDNLDRSLPNNGLFFFNRNSGIVNPNRQNVTVRAHPVQAAVEALNGQVHRDIRAQNPNSVWQYYNLIGVQGAASNFGQDNDFYLANIVTETNEALRSFSGSLDNSNGTIDPRAINVHKGASTFIGGGCKGCHGNAQAGAPPPPGVPGTGKGSFDFSFITAQAPFEGIPDAVNQPLLR